METLGGYHQCVLQQVWPDCSRQISQFLLSTLCGSGKRGISRLRIQKREQSWLRMLSRGVWSICQVNVQRPLQWNSCACVSRPGTRRGVLRRPLACPCNLPNGVLEGGGSALLSETLSWGFSWWAWSLIVRRLTRPPRKASQRSVVLESAWKEWEIWFILFWLDHKAWRISVPWSGIKPKPWYWKPGLLTTEPSGNPQV